MAAFEKSSSRGEDDCVCAGLQTRKLAWKEHPAMNRGGPASGKKFEFFTKVCRHLPKLYWKLPQVCFLSPMLVFGSFPLSSAAKKLPLPLAKERMSWPQAGHPHELE